MPLKDLVISTAFMFMMNFLSVRYQEKKDWNKGRCAICKEPWEIYDVDVGDVRLYKCKNNHFCNVFRVDKIK